MNHKTHLYLMIGGAVAAVLLLSSGNAGGWSLYVWLGACAVMMFVMMRAMGGGHGRGGMGGDTTEKPTETLHNAGHGRDR